jgi:hypothetical protein
MNHDLRIMMPLAAKVVLYSIPESPAPEVLREIRSFATDRGAATFILLNYLGNDDLEQLLLTYWDSRIQEDSFRIEETLAAMLLAVALSVLANIIYSTGVNVMKNFLPLAHSEFVKKLYLRRARNTDNAISVYNLLRFRSYIYGNLGIDDRLEFFKMLEFLKSGGSLKSYLHGNRLIELCGIKGLDNMDIVARGLIETPPTREIAQHSYGWAKIVPGLHLAGLSAFGEIINCHYPDFIGISKIKGRVNSASLYPTQWGHIASDIATKPKVLFLDDRLFTDVFSNLNQAEIKLIVGFVTNHGGMTCHTGVTSRGMGKAAIAVNLNFSDIFQFKFAALGGENLFLNQDFPIFAEDDLSRLLSYQTSKFYVQ